MSHLSLTEPLDLLDRKFGSKAKGIEVAHRSEGAWKSGAKLGGIGNPTE